MNHEEEMKKHAPQIASVMGSCVEGQQMGKAADGLLDLMKGLDVTPGDAAVLFSTEHLTLAEIEGASDDAARRDLAAAIQERVKAGHDDRSDRIDGGVEFKRL